MKKIITLSLALFLTACVQTGLPHDQRPAQWAQAITTTPDLPNLYQVTTNFYRSAQPNSEGLVILNNMQRLTANQNRPIRTVLSLRADRSDETIFPSRNVHYVQIPIDTWRILDSDVIKALQIINTPEMQPVLLHCKHGADRTGLVTAIYRIIYQGWSKEEAIKEMRLGGYGFHPMWKNLITYINALNVEAMRAKIQAAGDYPEPAFHP